MPTRSTLFFIRGATLTLGLISAIAAHADSPLVAPKRHTVCSSSGTVCAISDPRANDTRVVHRPSGKTLWSIPGWHRWLFLSNDGMSLAIGYAGMNLIPADSSMDLPVIHFYREGRLLRALQLSDLYRSRSQLPRTASHLQWVEAIRVNNTNQLVLHLITGEIAAFSMQTGRRTSTAGDDYRGLSPVRSITVLGPSPIRS